MELNPSEATQILRAHRIDVSDEDPRPVTAIAEQFMLTGDVALKGAQAATEKVVWPVDL
jgi:hypothetical protein